MQSASGQPRIARLLAVVSVGVVLAYLDLFVVNLAIPALAEEFEDAGLAELSWVLNAYTILFAAFLVPLGGIADRVGRRRIFLGGLAVFVAASALCALAPSVETLIAARSVQALGAATLIPTSLALLLAAAPPARHARLVAAWSALAGIAAALGPPLAGLLVEADWRWIFALNVPIGLAALAAGNRVIAESRDERARGWPDLAGAALLFGAIACLAFALVESDRWGWESIRTLGSLAIALGLAVGFTRRCARHPNPILELSLLRARPYALANLTSLLFNVGFAALLLGSVVFLTSGWGESVLVAGLAIAPGPLTAAAISLPPAAVGQRLGQARVAAAGGAVFALGCGWWLWRLDPVSVYAADFLPGIVATGAAVGMVLPTLSAIAAASLPPARLAGGIAVVVMARQIGAVLGVALLIAAFGEPTAAQLFGAFDRGFALMVVAGLAAAAAALAIGLGVPARRAAPAPAPAREGA